MGQYDINLRDYWRIIRKRKIIIIFTVVILSFFSFVFAKMNEPPPIYSASSAVRLEQNTALSGLVSEGTGLGGQFQEISTQTAVIRSYPVMERVAKEMGLIDKSLTSEEIAKNSRLVSVINGLASQVQTEQVGDTNIISITVTSGDPDQAARMANTIAVVFRDYDYQARNQTVLKQHRFIKSQLEASEKRLREAEQRIKNFKKENQFLSISVEAQTLGNQVTRLTQITKELRKKLRRVRTAIEQVRAVRDARAGGTERLPLDEIDPGLARFNNQLSELQIKRDTLLENFTEAHPAVQDTIQQIRNVIREILSVLEGREKSLKLELDQRQAELAKLGKRYEAVPDTSLQLSRLERQLATNMEVHTLLRQKFEEVNIKLAGTQHLVTIVKPAFRPLNRDNPPQITLNTFVGALLGLVVGLVFALVLETMDTSIGAIEDVEAFLEVPVLGVIPVLDPEELERQYEESNPDRAGRFSPDIYGRLVTHFVPRSPIAEAYRSFRTQMEFVSIEKGGNTFVITSSTPGEGKTTTAINFAVTCAQSNKRTLLIDADMRKPVIYRIFGIDREPGLTDILLGNNSWEECIRTMTDIMLGKFDMEDIMLTPGLDNLNLLTCGNIPPNPSELLNSMRMTQFLEEIKSEFDVIILDTPPLLPVTDAAVLGTRVDGCVLVYRVGHIARGALKRAKMQLDNVRANVWGVVLNSMRAETSPDLDAFKYQSSYYYGGYAEEATEEDDLALPFYQRWFRRAKSLILPAGGGDVEYEASPVAKILGALIIALALALTAAGFSWQSGVELPLVGALRVRYDKVGQPPPGALPPLDAAWEAVQERLAEPAPAPVKAPAEPPAEPAPPAGPPEEGTPPGASVPAPRSGPAAPKPERGASLRMPPMDAPWDAPSDPARPPELLPASVLRRRAVLRLAGLLAATSRRPFGVTFSTNRLHATTRRQLDRLRKGGLSPHFVPVRYPDGVLERVFLGAFATREEAGTFLRERVAPLAVGGERPFIDRLPYAIEVARALPAGEADMMRVLLKAAGLSPYSVGKPGAGSAGAGSAEAGEKASREEGRMLVGAFRRPAEARLAARRLRRERISFRLAVR